MYRSVGMVLDLIEAELTRFLAGKAEPPATKGALSDFSDILSHKKVKYELLALLSGTSIAEKTGNRRN